MGRADLRADLRPHQQHWSISMPVNVSPSIPTESSAAVPAGGFSTWFKNIGDWLKSMSPTGATQYDTDWVTTGITMTPGPGFTIDSYRMRRIGKTVHARIAATYTGAGFNSNAFGNFTDLTVATLPTAWSPTGEPWELNPSENGFRQWFGRITELGNLQITHGLPTQTMATNTAIMFRGIYCVA